MREGLLEIRCDGAVRDERELKLLPSWPLAMFGDEVLLGRCKFLNRLSCVEEAERNIPPGNRILKLRDFKTGALLERGLLTVVEGRVGNFEGTSARALLVFHRQTFRGNGAQPVPGKQQSKGAPGHPRFVVLSALPLKHERCRSRCQAWPTI